MNKKQQLRKTINTQRLQQNHSLQDAASTQIIKNIQLLDSFKSAQTVALYKAIRGEVNLEALFALCWASKKRTFIPLFNTHTKCYEMAEVTNKTQYKTGHYNIQEPINAKKTAMSQIDLIAVPGVAFDRKGNRLGRGGGYYDRLLTGYSGDSIAVAFNFQIVDHIPYEPHDRPVDSIVTEIKSVKECNEY